MNVVNRTCSCWEYCLLSKLPPLSNNGKFSFSAALCALSSFGLLSWVWSTSPGGPPTCISCIRRSIAVSPALRPGFDIHCPVFDSSSCFLRQRMHTHITCNQTQIACTSISFSISRVRTYSFVCLLIYKGMKSLWHEDTTYRGRNWKAKWTDASWKFRELTAEKQRVRCWCIKRRNSSVSRWKI